MSSKREIMISSNLTVNKLVVTRVVWHILSQAMFFWQKKKDIDHESTSVTNDSNFLVSMAFLLPFTDYKPCSIDKKIRFLSKKTYEQANAFSLASPTAKSRLENIAPTYVGKAPLHHQTSFCSEKGHSTPSAEVPTLPHKRVVRGLCLF